MKTITTLIALAGAAAAQNYMHVMSVRSGSPIRYLPWTASGLKIYMGGNTASYCPIPEVSLCPPGNTTTFISGQGTLYMGAEVPGGQQVYIDSYGAVAYAQAHSAAVPQGAIFSGWNVTVKASAAGTLGRLSWNGGLLACPSVDTGKYQVFAQVEGVQFPDDCHEFDALFSNSAEPSAWQYT